MYTSVVILHQPKEMASRPSLENLHKDISEDKLDSQCKEDDLKILALSTTNWRRLAPLLGFEESDIEDIMSDYPGNVRQAIALYMRWRAKALANATYRRLMEKLYTIRRIDLVEKVVELLKQSKKHDICEDDDHYTVYLRRFYRTQVTEQGFEWPPLPHCRYVHLALSQEAEPQQLDNDLRKAITQETLQENKHSHITLDNIMVLDQSRRKFIVIEGAPGVGKSMLTLHVCREWAAGMLFDSYMYVILVQLHHHVVQEAKCLADLIYYRPTTNEAKYARDLSDKIVSEDGKNAVFIIDGWDKLPLRYRKNSFIHKFLFEPYNVGVSMSTVLITSRANASADLQQIATSRVRILGFPPPAVEEYFMEVFKKDKDKAERLLAHFRLFPSLHNTCYIPLNAAIIAHIYSYKVLPLTLHSAFCMLVLNSILHEISEQIPRRKLKVSSLKDLPPDLKRQLNQIACLAYKGSLHNKATFSEDELKQLSLPSTFPTLGLLQEVEYFTDSHKTKYYSFMHSSVQQFLAAFHMSQWKPAQQADAFAKSFSFSTVFVPQVYVHSFFQYFAGFSKLEGKEIKECVLQVVQAYKKACSSYHGQTSRKLPFLSLVECLYEAQNESLHKLVATHLEGQIKLAHIPLDLYKLLSIGHLLCFFRTEETLLLVLSHAHVHDEGLDYLFKNFKGKTCTLKLDLQSNQLSAKSVKVSIAPLLRTNKLVDLNLSFNSIFNEGARHIASALASNTSLLVLTLNYCAIEDEGICEISNAISSNHTLQELFLSGNPFTNDGLMLVSATLEGNKGLRKLRIDPNMDSPDSHPVTVEGLQLFIGRMADNHITELDIGEFGAQDEEVIETLKMSNERRKERGIQVLTLFCSGHAYPF